MLPLHIQLANSTLPGALKRLHFPLNVMLVCVRWYAAYPLSLRNLVEQDHRAVKRRVRPMLGFETFESARNLIAGIETMHMIKKGQRCCPEGLVVSDADRFYSLAAR